VALNEIGRTVDKTVTQHGYKVCRDLRVALPR
jgi:hypothetical protein